MNKGELRAHFIALLNRSDCPNALADTFISQALGRILRTLRIPSMEKQQAYAVASSGGLASLNLPSDLLETIDIYYDGEGLVRIPMHEMVAAQKTGQLGSPRFFTREQGTFLLHPKPISGSIKLNYYAEFPALVNDSDNNSLTNSASDAIIYTALGYSSDYFLDDRSELFEVKSGMFLRELQDQADTAEQSGGTQVMRPTALYED